MKARTIGIVAALSMLGSLLVFIVIIGIADVVLIRTWGVDASISRGMERIGQASPAWAAAIMMAVGYTLGTLTGHFWWSQPPLERK